MSETVRYAIGTFLGLGSFGALLYLKGRFDGRHAERAAQRRGSAARDGLGPKLHL